LQSKEIEVVVVIMTKKHHVNAGEIFPL
jgi:hypothetical protein